MTVKQAELMGSRSITPMIVVELELDTVEVLKRGLADKMKPKTSENEQHLCLLTLILCFSLAYIPLKLAQKTVL